MPEYNNESKNQVRELMLSSAISALTSRRNSRVLINHDELKVTFEYFLELIKRALKSSSQFAQLRYQSERELASWLEFDLSTNRPKRASELKVLYLCGPSPTNDLSVLLNNGVNIHNVWAVTDSKDGAAAHKALSTFNLALKIHEGSLAEFFESFNEVFDIIYFDACAPFMGGSPNALHPIWQVLQKQRLNPKGALITNYSTPPDDGPARQRYVSLATAYYHPRYEDIPDVIRKSELDPAIFAIQPDMLKNFIAENLESTYSDLITQLTVDLAGVIIPNLRAFSMPAFLRKHVSPERSVGSRMRRSDSDLDENGLPHDRWNSPQTYPILSFVDRLEEFNLQDPLLERLRSHNRQGLTYKHLISISELTKSVVEGHWGSLSPELLAAVRCSWFDYRHRLTCDTPFPNLLVSSLIGTYGRPYLYNSRLSKRVSYTSSVRRMFCDLFVFDQCRSFFDWFPTVQACSTRFESIAFQIVARCLIDRMSWHNFYNTAKPFKWAAIGGIGETPAAKPRLLPKRKAVD